MKIYDHVIGRRGDSLTGKVLDKEFTITSVLATLRIKTKDITWIHFTNPPQFKQDEIWLKNGDKLTGKVQQEQIHFQTMDKTKVTISSDVIHTLMINQKWNLRGRYLQSR